MITVRLLSWTRLPIETVYSVWQASRTNEALKTPDQVAKEIATERLRRQTGEPGPFETEVHQIFRDCLAMKIPVVENINFVFMLEGVPVALREQLVRHRIGMKVGDNYGVDIVPELASSSWWSQSMRVLDMGTFAAHGDYFTPDSFEGKVVETRGEKKFAGTFFREQMMWIQNAYRKLVDAGIPLEDARCILPLATTHRISWSLNLASMLHVIGKRTCWILQLGFWKPVIQGMLEELSRKVDPAFQTLCNPPCLNHEGQFTKCHFEPENGERIRGDIPLPPCSLFLGTCKAKAHEFFQQAKFPRWFPNSEGHFDTHDSFSKAKYLEMREDYRRFWNRDPSTGAAL